MGRACIGFEMADEAAALAHMSLELLIDYGDRAYGHSLQPWDEGGRRLFRCKACGGCILIQESEFHSFCGDDSYYVDYYPVSGPEEADQLNRLYDGLELEAEFPKRFLSNTNGRWYWRKGVSGRDRYGTDRKGNYRCAEEGRPDAGAACGADRRHGSGGQQVGKRQESAGH